MESLELHKFGQYLRDNFRDALTEHTGDIHDYLGIDLDYSRKGKFGVSMIKYLHELLTGFFRNMGLYQIVQQALKERIFLVLGTRKRPNICLR